MNCLIFGIIVVFGAISNVCDGQNITISRASFPKGFVFGTASAAYQVSLFYFMYSLSLIHPFQI